LHQADIALGDHFVDGQTIAAIAHGDLRHQTQMAGDELMRRLGVFMFTPALGEHVFLLRIKERKFANFGEVTRKAAFAYDWKRPCRHVLNPLTRTTVRMCKRTSYHGANAPWIERIPHWQRIWASGAPIARCPRASL